MAKLVPNTRQGRQVEGGKSVIHESVPGGMRKIRGPNHQIAVPAHTRNGESVFKSPDGTTYKSRPLK